jgi:tetratricopeptide (TPR) repeat protein
MKTIYYALFIAIFLSIISNSIVFPAENNASINNVELQKMKDSVSEIRRDQLNYKIEKDLLRETFSSNYQTINIVLALVLGIFTIIGVLGIRDIGSIRKEYLKEFENLSNLRKDFDFERKKVTSELEEVKDNFLKIIKTNEEQTKRIRILELQGKISTEMKGANYKQALEYIKVALAIDPKNSTILTSKARCFWKLNQLPKALDIYEHILELEPENKTVIQDLLELYLFLKQFDNFNGLYEKNELLINSKGGESGAKTYYRILEMYQSNKYSDMKIFLKKQLAKIPNVKQVLFGWDFSDVLKLIQSNPEDEGKVLMNLYIDVARGNKSSAEALLTLNN